MKYYINKLLDKKDIFEAIITLVCIVAKSVLSVYPILLIQQIVDIAIKHKADEIGTIIKYGAIYLLLQVLNSFFSSWVNYLTKFIQANLSLKIQNNLYQSLYQTKISYIRNGDSVEFQQSLIQDSEYVSQNIVEPFVEIVNSLLTFCFGFYFMSRINMTLTLVILPLGIISALIIRIVSEKSHGNLTVQREKMTQLWKVFSEGIYGFIPVKMHSYADVYFKKVKVSGDSLRKVQLQQGKLESLSYFLTSSLFMVTIGLILIISAVLVTKKTVSVGGLTAILMYNHMLTDPLLNLLQINQKLIKLSVSMKRILKIDDYPKETDENRVSVDEVVLDEVSYSVGGKKILEHVNLKLKSPVSLGISGQTGVGKTTLVNLITNILKPQSGCIIYKKQGIAVAGRPKISYLLQDEYIFDDTIKNNILIGNQYLSEERFRQLIEICDLTWVLQSHQDSLGENGVKLSGGERKRVLLARVLADDSADIYIFDELSASLDQHTFEEIYNKIELFLFNKIRIYIEHNIAIKDKTDFLYELKERELVEFANYK